MKTPKPPPPFVCADGRIFTIAPWSYSVPGGPFRSAIEVSRDGAVLSSVDVDVSRAEVRACHSQDEVLGLLVDRICDALNRAFLESQ